MTFIALLLSVTGVTHEADNALIFNLYVSFDSIISSGIEVDNVAFDQFLNVLLLFSGTMLSIRVFFTIAVSFDFGPILCGLGS